MIKYRVGHRAPFEIREVEIARETSKSITWYSGNVSFTRRKHSAWENFFDTWEEAHHHLMAIVTKELRQAENALHLAKGHYGNVKGMKPPNKKR